MYKEAELKQLNKDKENAKKAIRKYLKHSMIPLRNIALEALIVELADEGTINVDWIEIY